MLLPLSCAHRCAPTRQDRPYLPLVVLACLALLVYLHPRPMRTPAYPAVAADPPLNLEPLPLNSSTPITASSLARLALPRFAALLARPILDYDASLALEALRCPATHRQANRDQLRGDGAAFWLDVTVDELRAARERVVERVRARFGWDGREEEGGSDGVVEGMLGEGRGLVFTAGKCVLPPPLSLSPPRSPALTLTPSLARAARTPRRASSPRCASCAGTTTARCPSRSLPSRPSSPRSRAARSSAILTRSAA